MTAENAYITWNKIEKRYELHIDDKFKGYSIPSEGAEDTQEGHKEGHDYLHGLATEKGYTVVSDVKIKGDVE